MPRRFRDSRSRITASTTKAPLLCQRIPVAAFSRGAGVLGIAPPTPKSNVSMRPQPTQPLKTTRTPIAATHIAAQSNIRKITPIGRRHRPASPIPSSPRVSRALSASRASSSPNSTGSSPAWPSPCRERPSGRRGRTRRATIRACGLRPALLMCNKKWSECAPGFGRSRSE